MKTRSKVWLLAIAALLLVIVALVGTKAAQIGSMIKAGKAFVPPPESVTSAKVTAAEWEGTRSAVGTLVASRGVTVGAELPGAIREVSFDSGASVRRGSVLVRLDTSAEEAQLAASRADASLARLSLARARSLRAQGANTPADLEAGVARAQSTAAAVAVLQASIAKKVIRAPFDGRVAIRQVELGQVVSPGTPIASVQAVSPIFAEFWLPQQALANLASGQRARLSTDTFPGATWEGVISTVNPEVDPATRNVRVRATFENPDGRLRPGMFVNVDLISDAKKSVLVVPATSVLFAPYGDSIFTIEPGKDAAGKDAKIVRQRFVRLGERRGDFVAVTSGLKAGETIVKDGAFKVRNGGTVVVNDALSPKAELAPTPSDK